MPLAGIEGLQQDSIILLEQVRTIDRSRLGEYIGRLRTSTMRTMDQAIAASFGLGEKECRPNVASYG